MDSKRQWKIAVAALALAPVTLLAAGCGGDNNSPGAPSGIVYTENNVASPNGNAVLAFRRDASGDLTSIGTFPTNGAGLGNALLTPNGTLDTDREIIINPQRTRLYAVNQGSNTIAVFPVNSDGTLGTATTYSSGGVAPVSLALVNNNLVVLNSSMGPDATVSTTPPNFSTFTINPSTGGLSASAVSTVALPVGQTPSIALPSPDGTLIFDADFRPQQTNPGVLRSFQLSSNGTLTETGSPLPLDASVFTGTNASAPPFILGLAVNPDPSKPFVYASAILAHQVAVYQYASNGALTFLKTVPNPGFDPCWIRVSPNGRWMYTSNAISGDISEYSLADPTTPTYLGAANVTASGAGTPQSTVNGNPWQFDVDPTSQFVYVLTPRDLNEPMGTTLGPGNTLHAFVINQSNGTLTPAPTFTYDLGEPAGNQPQGLLAI